MPRKPAAPVRHAYHHGALRQALIDASDALLAERGVAGFSLREVARRSGVAPSAPAHHFGDTAGLLDAVATVAFEGLTEALLAGNARGGADPLARLREQGVGYVGFALRYPERFNLMFRNACEPSEALRRHAQAAFQVLEDGVRDFHGAPAGAPLTAEQRLTLLTVWSVVHGFAHLAIAGQFELFQAGKRREEFVRATLAPLLQRQVDALAGLHGGKTAPRKAPARKPTRP